MQDRYTWILDRTVDTVCARVCCTEESASFIVRYWMAREPYRRGIRCGSKNAWARKFASTILHHNLKYLRREDGSRCVPPSTSLRDSHGDVAEYWDYGSRYAVGLGAAL